MAGNLQGTSEITQLPPYLSVKMVRFFYKVDVQQKAKILRKVGFRWHHFSLIVYFSGWMGIMLFDTVTDRGEVAESVRD